MPHAKLQDLEGNPKPLDTGEVEALSRALEGSLITPGDADYDETRAIWNAMIDRKPGLIARCASTDDIVASVNFARKHGVLVSIRGAGHNIAGKALHDGAMLIDLSGMRDVQVDPRARRAVVSPGATLGDVDAATQAHALAVPLGINSTTGISGLTLGGGFGWLSRSLGLTIDNLVAAEVVTADGKITRCSESENADLFWATRGGGGNFGVVSSFEFALHPVGPEVMSGPVVFPADQAPAVLRKYREFVANVPDELAVWAVLRDAPPLPFLDPAHHGKPSLILVGLYNGPMEQGEALMAPLRELGTPVGDGIGPHPYAGFQQAFDPLLTPGARNYWKSHNFIELADGLLDVLVDYAGKLPSPQSEIFIGQLGGATTRPATDATAYPHRDAEYVMNVHTRWDETSDDQRCVEWAREFYAATRPFATGGVYVNFISEGDDQADGAYGANIERLRRVKSKYDPDNFFRTNQNITPKS